MIIIVTEKKNFDEVTFVVNESTEKKERKKNEKISKGMHGMWFRV
jgi:hypothetical protein